MDRKCGREKSTRYQVANSMVRSVHKVDKYTKIHIRYKSKTESSHYNLP
jgi:hypothetical protein